MSTTKKHLAELIRSVRDGVDGFESEAERALFALCDDLGFIETLCKILPESVITDLEVHGGDVLW